MTEMLGCFLNQTTAGFTIRHIGGNVDHVGAVLRTDPLGQGVIFLTVGKGVEDNTRAQTGQFLRDAQSNAGIGAGDDSDFVFDGHGLVPLK